MSVSIEGDVVWVTVAGNRTYNSKTEKFSFPINGQVVSLHRDKIPYSIQTAPDGFGVSTQYLRLPRETYNKLMGIEDEDVTDVGEPS